jgi:hypothetical protein
VVDATGDPVWHPMSGYDPNAERMVVVGGDGVHVR